jgi:hypothetical protein
MPLLSFRLAREARTSAFESCRLPLRVLMGIAMPLQRRVYAEERLIDRTYPLSDQNSFQATQITQR